ncbi:MAG: hypothetical protein Q9166_005249 [cf. Caloplaca sp. 2 TL-2023]
MELVNTITDKPDWQRKVFDDVIVAKWRAEALTPKSLRGTPKASPEAGSAGEGGGSQSSTSRGEVEVSPRMLDWVIAEVKYKADIFKQFNCIEALDGVWKSDTIVDEKLRIALEDAVRPLEDVPDSDESDNHVALRPKEDVQLYYTLRNLDRLSAVEDKDWHPGSNGQVLDLVHPSIYPLVYGQSLILTNENCGVSDCTTWIGKGQTLQLADTSAQLGSEWSKKFQWLPAEFEASPNSNDINAKSYINNLHPRDHPDLYSIIPQIMAKVIPLWDRVLSHVVCPTIPPRVSDWSNSYEGYKEDPEEQPGQEEDEDTDTWQTRLDEWRDQREVVEPEPGEFKTTAERIQGDGSNSELNRPQPPDTHPCVNLRKDYGRLQVIVKLANIHLTPEKPEYPGGSWHVEGQANESIHNITDSFLSFRQQVDEGRHLPYPQDEWKAVQQIFGIENEGPAIQNLGQVLTRESRLLCFPNVMQHRVSPFKLADPSKSGYRKILALFLVDPHLKIISTENVPPQQHSWWRKKVQDAGVYERLPPELAENVVSGTGFPVTLEKAREQRTELMAERKEFVKIHNENFETLSTFGVSLHHIFTSGCVCELTQRQLCEH